MGSWAKALSSGTGIRLGAVLGITAIGLLGGVIFAGPVSSSEQEIVAPLPVSDVPQYEHPPQIAPDAQAGASFLQHFNKEHDPTRWHKSNLSYPGAHPAWLSRQIHFFDDRVELELRRMRVGDKTLAGAEYQRRGFYSFGRFEVVMTPAPGSGTVSSLFTHTHAQFGDPHDEIDIEFLGKDLSVLAANYFTDGASHGTIPIRLPFDASEEIHLYAFEWEPDAIRWYVNDQLWHTATAKDQPIPQSPGRIIISLWSGGPGQFDWHGVPTFEDGTRAAFYCVSFQKSGETSPQCSDTFDPVAANAAKRAK